MRILLSLSGLALVTAVCHAQGPAEAATSTLKVVSTYPVTVAADYVLMPGDYLSVSVQDESDFSAQQAIDSKGVVKLPHLGPVALAGKSLRDAEAFLESTLSKGGFLKKPQVTITITTYAPREVFVNGQVKAPAPVLFPRDTTALDIVDVIHRAGGFTPVANMKEVAVGRKQPDGTERTEIVDVERLLKVDTRGLKTPERVWVYPGDRVWVKARIIL